MKKSKLKLVLKILAIVVICLISFIGIYVQKGNKMKNIIKDFKLSKDLKGYRQIIFEVSDATEVLDEKGLVVGNSLQYSDSDIEANSYQKSETKVNKDEDINKENYELTKTIMQKRLDALRIDDYTISLDKETGKIYLQIPEDENADRVVSNLAEKGSFEIKDSEDGTVHISAKHIKKANAMYNTTETGTVAYLLIQLNKEGKDILKDISTNQYAKIEETTDENEISDEAENETAENETDNSEDKESENENEEDEENKDENKQKEIVLSISGNNMLTTSFEEPNQTGEIPLSMNTATTDTKEINDALSRASTIAALIQNGELPIIYEATENQYVTTDISNELVRNVIIVLGVIIAILLVFMIIKNKLRGLLAVISYIGFTALYLLLIKYTNTEIALSGIFAMMLVLALNYIFNMKLLTIDIEDDKSYKKEYLKFIMKMIPLLVISIAFIFVGWMPLSSFGMLTFWGMALIMIYNILITKNITD